MGAIRVMLVDDHPLFRQGIKRVVESEPGMTVVGEADDGIQAVETATRLKPDVLITDINLPGKNGLQITRDLTEIMPEIAIIVLTAFDDDEQIFHAMRAGASAYFSKDVTPPRLVAAVRHCAEGNYVIEDEVLDKPDVADWLLRHFEQVAYVDGIYNDMFGPLSPREMEILQHIAKGLSNKEIAYHLGISRQTVKNHMTSILRKLAVNDRTQAALYAVRRGWIHLRQTEVEGP